MSFLSALKGSRARSRDTDVWISERGGVRTLHLGSDTVQSAMRIAAPDDLELSYTRAMMGFLLFHPSPRQFLMIGLGGGSVAKFSRRAFAGASIAVVECNRQVVAMARSMFCVPPDDERFRVIIDDGGEYVRAHPACCDVLMVDAYDARSQVEALATEDFYEAARQALEPDGVLVVNLWSSDPRFDAYLQRIERVFGCRVVCLPAERKGNVAVFAFRGRVPVTRWDQLRERARALEPSTGLEMLKFVGRLAELNPHSDHRLLV
ncbi:MAG: polyamine aminopropyltransferase [Betaproteobacteria bacterium]|jgi:spermidine synthase